MRVVAGENGGRHLLAPAGRSTRPTSDRVREAAFSMLQSLGALQGATVWDLFCGSGAMGIEALSRGAGHVTFVDNGRQALAATRSNLAALGYGPSRAAVVNAEALNWAQGRSGTPLSGVGGGSGRAAPGLVLADPPYAWGQWPELLSALSPHRPLVLAESGSALAGLPEGWSLVRSKRYGGTVVTLACFDAGDDI